MAKKKTNAATDTNLTLADLSAKYIAWMEQAEKSAGTIGSYSMELKLAQSEIGADTRTADLTPARVQEYFDCKRVTLLKSGAAKAKPSIDKTRRVLRLALVYAEQHGLIAKAPLPMTDDATPAVAPAPTPEPAPAKRTRKPRVLVDVVNEPQVEAPAA